MRSGRSADAALAEQPVDRDEDHEGDAGGAEVAEARDVVGPVGVHDGGRDGELEVAEVVVDDDDIDAARRGHGRSARR